MKEKVDAVLEVFKELDEAIHSFQQHSGLHCLHGCGKCCFKPDIEATVLEFLPLAYSLYLEGKGEEIYASLLQRNDPLCLVLQPKAMGVGLCGNYTNRGLICRLFGFSARTDKYGKMELVTCQVIKEAFPEQVKKVQDESKEMPVMNRYYMKMHSIDPALARDFYPINEAIRKAFEEVFHYFAYRNPSP